jgi:CelD/BcsL family acetyltransferase involved in cellulose biosynthesis
LMGTGVSDYLDGVWDPEFQADCGQALLAYLIGNRRRWSACDFQELRGGSPLLEAGPIPPRWSEEILIQDNCPALRLDPSDGGLGRSIPPHQLKNLRYYERRIGRMGRIHIEQAADYNLEELLEALIQLHTARWAIKGRSGVLAERDVRRFHAEAASELLSSGALRLYGLRLNQKIIASYHGFIAKERAYFYLGGFDPAWERFSPGMVLLGHAMEEAVRAGAKEFDFLRGEEAYKYKWGAKNRPNFQRRITQGVTSQV